jgi:broad specificity phosphatase PhoE
MLRLLKEIQYILVYARMIKFTFLRHAEGIHNVEARLHGPVAYTFLKNRDAPLTDEGWNQTKKANGSIDISIFTHIYCSPSLRCRQTLLGVEPISATLSVKLDDRLMEPQGGDICNKRAEKKDLCLPAMWDIDGVSDVNPWDIDPDSLRNRVVSITEEIRTKYPESNILIVSHHQWVREWFRIYEQRDVLLRNCEITQACLKT